MNESTHLRRFREEIAINLERRGLRLDLVELLYLLIALFHVVINIIVFKGSRELLLERPLYGRACEMLPAGLCASDAQ